MRAWLLAVGFGLARARKDTLVVDSGQVRAPDIREADEQFALKEAPAELETSLAEQLLDESATSLAEQLLDESAQEFPRELVEVEEITTTMTPTIRAAFVNFTHVAAVVDPPPAAERKLQHGAQCGWPALCPPHIAGYVAPFVAVAFTVLSAVCMKRAEGFAHSGYAAAAAIAVAAAVLANTAMPQSSWAYSRAAERLGVAACAVLVFGDRLTPWRGAAIGLGAIGAGYLEIGEALSSNVAVDAAALKAAVWTVDVVAVAFCCLAAALLRPEGRARVTPLAVKYLALFIAAAFGVVRTVILVHSPTHKEHCLVARVLCGWASTAGLVVLLDFLDLGPGWMLCSGLEALGSISVAYAAQRALPTAKDAAAGGLVLASVAFLLCEAAVYERFLQGANFAPRLSKDVDPFVRRRLLEPAD